MGPLLALLLAACPPPPLPPADPGEILVATASSAPYVAPVLMVSVTTPRPASVWIEAGLTEQALSTVTPIQQGTSLTLPVLGLKAGRTYLWRAVAQAGDGQRLTSPLAPYTVPSPPGGLDRYTVLRDTGDSVGGWLLTSVIRLEESSGWVGILDRDGDWVWWVPTEAGRVPLSAELSADGTAILWGEYDLDRSQPTLDRNAMVRVALDGSTRRQTRLPGGHHDFVAHPDGTVGFLAQSAALLGPGPDAALVHADRIDEVPAGADHDVEPAVIFDTFEDYPHPAVSTCEHMITPQNTYGVIGPEWTHGNSLLYLEEQDAYYLGARYTDWLLKIDRGSGRLLWQLNGLEGDFTLPDGSAAWEGPGRTHLWGHGHISQLWPGGMMVFDNGDHRSGQASRVVEIAFDEEARTAEVVWAYPHPDGRFTPSMGDARKLPGGNVLTAWAGLREIIEVTPDGRVAWKARSHRPDVLGRITWIRDLARPEPPQDPVLDPPRRPPGSAP